MSQGTKYSKRNKTCWLKWLLSFMWPYSIISWYQILIGVCLFQCPQKLIFSKDSSIRDSFWRWSQEILTGNCRQRQTRAGSQQQLLLQLGTSEMQCKTPLRVTRVRELKGTEFLFRILSAPVGYQLRAASGCRVHIISVPLSLWSPEKAPGKESCCWRGSGHKGREVLGAGRGQPSSIS